MLFSYALSLWHAACLWQRYMVAWTKARLHARFGGSRPAWEIRSAFSFCEDTGDFLDVTAHFKPDSWETDIQQYSGWDTFRVDLRYTHTTKFGKVSKYRMILRNGDTCVFPPCLGTTTTTVGTTRGPRGVLSATLVPRTTVSAREVDVTSRLQKYAGPLKDFHKGAGLTVNGLDCFPFDDADLLQSRFEFIRLIDAATLKETTFELKSPLSLRAYQ